LLKTGSPWLRLPRNLQNQSTTDPFNMTTNTSTEYRLLGRTFDLAKAQPLVQFDEFDLADWISVGTPPWHSEGSFIEGGKIGETNHGQLFYKEPFPGDVVLEFDAQVVPPCTHDLIWWFRTELKNQAWGNGYLGGLGGWYNNRAGLERAPDFKLFTSTGAFKLKPGQWYHIVSGIIDNSLFTFVDGELINELCDPTPIPPSTPGHIGFGVYQSMARFTRLKIHRPVVETFQEAYVGN
jgi:hypothetical protein